MERRLSVFDVIVCLATRPSGGVYLARRRGLDRFNRLFCLKTWRSAQVAEDEVADAFGAEARVLTRLRHPNCVRVFEVGSVGETLYLAMEYLFGETFRFLLDEARESGRAIPREVVCGIVVAAAEGLHGAHELDIVHRDVSPENIIAPYDDRPKVLDFGIAKFDDAIETRTGLIKGKVAYMSPEQITGQRIDHRSDIFALGIILHEAFGNHRLFAALSAQDVVYRLHKDPPPPIGEVVADLPDALKAATDRALAFDPDERFPTALALADELRAHAAEDVGAYLRDHFLDRFTTRRRVLDECLRGTHDLDELLQVLDARPMTHLDFEEAGPDEEAPTTGVLVAWGDDVVDRATERSLITEAPDERFEAIDTNDDATAPPSGPALRSHRMDSTGPTAMELDPPPAPPKPTREDRTPTAALVEDTAPMAQHVTPSRASAVAARRLEEMKRKKPTTLDAATILTVALGLVFGIAIGIAATFYLVGVN